MPGQIAGPQFDAGSNAPLQGMLQGATDSQNWMTQAADRQRTQAQTQQMQQQTSEQQQKFQALLPAMVAKNAADTASFNAQAGNAARIQQYRLQAADLGPQAQGEFLDNQNVATLPDTTDPQTGETIPGGPDYEGQYNNLSEISAKYAGLAQLPEWAPLMKQIDTAKQNAYEMAIKHSLADIALQKTQAVQEAISQRSGWGNQTKVLTTGMQVAGGEQNAHTRAAALVAARGEAAGAANVRQLSQAAMTYDRMAMQPGLPPEEKAQYQQLADQYRTQWAATNQQGQQQGGSAAPASGGTDVDQAINGGYSFRPITAAGQGGAPSKPTQGKPAGAAAKPASAPASGQTAVIDGKTYPVLYSASTKSYWAQTEDGPVQVEQQ